MLPVTEDSKCGEANHFAQLMSKKYIIYPSPRVSQLDAHILDGELFSLLKQQLADSFQLLSGKSWSYGQQPELWNLALRLLIFHLTTYKSGSSYGLKLQNLKLSNSSTGKVIGRGTKLMILGTLFGDFFFKKLQSYLYSLEGGHITDESLRERIKAVLLRNKETVLKRIDDTIKVLDLCNFVSFLVHGRYPTILHRVLGLSMTPVIADLLKFDADKVNFEFQNRQLVWNVMTEFLVFIFPMLQLRKVKRLILNLLPNTKRDQYRTTAQTPIQTRFTTLPIAQCAICIETIERNDIKAASTYVTNAFITNCGHIFCYVCLATRFNAIENGNEEAEGCPRCRMKLESFHQYGAQEDMDADAIMVKYEEVEGESDEEVSEAGEAFDERKEIELDSDQEPEVPIGKEKEDFSEMEDLEEDVDDDVDEELDDYEEAEDDDFDDDDAFYE